MDLSYTVEQVTALREAVARGVTRVRMNGEEVQYSSLAEMRKQLAIMERAVEGQDRVTHFQPGYCRGI